ncbi:MAG TPA: hypothetical protein VJ927_07095 [Actinomycetota bacterium]|nr:hypothetical protein [Actinomycetota bacterium]
MSDIETLVRETLRSNASAYVPGDLAEAEQTFVAHRRRRRAYRFAIAAAATGAAAVVAIALVSTQDIVKQDALPVGSQSLRVIDTVPVPAEPLAISAGPPGIWVASREAGEVTLVGRDGEIVRSYGLPGASEIVAGGARAWAGGQSGHVVAYDEETLEQIDFEVFNNMSASVVDMAVGGTMHGAAWSVDSAGCVMDLTNPGPDFDCNAPEGFDPEELQPTDVATDDDETWLLDGEQGELYQLRADPGVNEGRAVGTGPVDLPTTPRGKYADLLVAADAIWVTGEGGNMMRFDLETGERTYTELGGDYADLATGFRWVWALVGFEGADRGTVVRIDPETGEVVGEELTLSGKPSDITIDGGGASGIWVTLRDANEVARIEFENGDL